MLFSVSLSCHNYDYTNLFMVIHVTTSIGVSSQQINCPYSLGTKRRYTVSEINS